MTPATIQEWQLLSCLEVEPTLLDPTVPWEYNYATYTVTQDEIRLHFSVTAASRDVHIILEHRAKRIYELSALEIADIVYQKEGNDERIDIFLTEQTRLTLRIKPSISLIQELQTTRA